MRFIVMHKVDANMEAGGPPSQDIITQMGALVQESLKSGVFLNGAGLHRSARRVRLESTGGETKVTQGPYAGKNELVASFTMLSAKSLNDAVGHARKLADAREPTVLPFTAAAREHWYQFAEYIEHNQGEGGRLESISDWTSKLPGAVARISALFQLASEGLGAVAVDAQSIQGAVRLAKKSPRRTPTNPPKRAIGYASTAIARTPTHCQAS